MPTLRIIQISEEISVEKIDGLLHEIIQCKFLNHLQITTTTPNTEESAEWVINMEDFNYLYGFRVRIKNKKIIFSSAINTWSIWAEHFTSEELASQLNSKILEINSDEESLNGPANAHPEEVRTFLSWLRKRSPVNSDKITQFYLYELNKLPPELRKIEGSLSLIL